MHYIPIRGYCKRIPQVTWYFFSREADLFNSRVHFCFLLRVECQTCGEASQRLEWFYQLNLHIPQAPLLLSAGASTSKADGGNRPAPAPSKQPEGNKAEAAAEALSSALPAPPEDGGERKPLPDGGGLQGGQSGDPVQAEGGQQQDKAQEEEEEDKAEPMDTSTTESQVVI